ncbi:septal ring lytic transglycosylase RlpA family protein [Hymenobacter sp. YC55]|uniref:septal ring lytic transglycosylase RlpA family protein n=1 Tax=Hymenobacter sp. YC55 TaxID=3034019 RepID=UPI0023F6B7DB|nr:septal ring lytic transglycosylase RlpA family protein [Hymenobacter sp. YC55]MDF7812564.1 septal ring lytic transglycosylase RlpA family protein [Hymenobacter sp. YC55]
MKIFPVSAHLLRPQRPRARRFSACSWLVLFVLTCLLGACSGGKSAFTQSGQGSYYADKFEGRKTASGTTYRGSKRTAAHNTLPFGTVIRVTNPRNHRSVKVTVTDRGPHAKGRIVDLSRKAARKIGIIDAGVAPVQLQVVKKKR